VGSNEAVDASDVEAQVVTLETAIEAGDLSEELAELSIGQVKIRDLMVEDADDDDPQLLFRDGRPVDTWRHDQALHGAHEPARCAGDRAGEAERA
jgi:hypothetical protein